MVLNRCRKNSQLSDEEYARWRDLVHQRIGLNIKENQLEFLGIRLRKRMDQLTIPTYGEYYNFVTEGCQNGHEWQQLIELLVNRESSFFRHLPSFNALMDNIFPEFAKNRLERGDRLISMWSAGCSRGQEAHSMAMCFAQVFGDQENCEIRITGTDISRNALARAQKGEYSFFETRNMPRLFKERYMMQIGMSGGSERPETQDDRPLAKHDHLYRVKDNIRKKIRFGLLNLNNPTGYWISMQDVIFCQNVLIYFSVQDRARVIFTLLKVLRPSGYLFLAPGDALHVKIEGATCERFKGALAYKRNEEAVHVRIVK